MTVVGGQQLVVSAKANRMRKTVTRLVHSVTLSALSFISSMLLDLSFPAEAQQRAAVPLIGVLTPASSPMTPVFEAFRQGLRELGYVEGKSILIEYRFAEGKSERLPALAVELVRLKVALIITDGNAAAQAAKQATATIPIVMGSTGDPVRAGLVASLARPGGNITGFSLRSPELSGKRLEILKEAFPKLSHVAVVWDSAAGGTKSGALQETEITARAFRVRIQLVEVRSPNDFESAFKALSGIRSGALMTLSSAMLWNHRERIVGLTAKTRLPAMFPEKEFVEAGGLMAYGPFVPDNYRRAATYVDKILKGAKPADLPVEQPTKFEFVINLKTAKQIGLTIPPNVLVRADKVIR